MLIEQEERISHPTRGNWVWCYETEATCGADRLVYLHLDCDCITNPEGYCVACGAPSPCLWASQGVLVGASR